MPTKCYLHSKLLNKKFCMHFPLLTCVVHAKMNLTLLYLVKQFYF